MDEFNLLLYAPPIRPFRWLGICPFVGDVEVRQAAVIAWGRVLGCQSLLLVNRLIFFQIRTLLRQVLVAGQRES
jgi:hypothetical protein